MSDEDKKFRFKFENIGYALTAIGALFIIMHWPGGKFYLVIGIIIVVIGLFFDNSGIDLKKLFKQKSPQKDRREKSSSYESLRNEKAHQSAEEKSRSRKVDREHKKNPTTETRSFGKFSNVVQKIGFGLTIVGVLFKIMHWPGASFWLLIGMTTVAVWFFLGAFTSEDD